MTDTDQQVQHATHCMAPTTGAQERYAKASLHPYFFSGAALVSQVECGN